MVIKMNYESFETLSKYVVINYRLLYCLMVAHYGDNADKIIQDIIKEVDKDFKKVNKNLEKEGKKNDKNN